MKKLQADIKQNSNVLLSGITVLVTRPKGKSAAFISCLKSYGAGIMEFPSIKITEGGNAEELNNCIGNFNSYDIVVFNSTNAVNFFMKKLPDTIRNRVASKKIFAIGPKTRDTVKEWGIQAEVISAEFNGRELANAIIRKARKGSRVLFPHGNLGNHELADLLNESGFQVTDLTVYANSEPDKEDIERFLSEAKNKYFDVVTFFSPSSIRNFLKVMTIPPSCIVAVIGSTTAQAAESVGLNPGIIAREATSEHLAMAIVDYYKLKGKEKGLA